MSLVVVDHTDTGMLSFDRNATHTQSTALYILHNFVVMDLTHTGVQ